MNIISSKRIVIPLVFLFFFILYPIIIKFVNTDMRTHAAFARQMLTGERTSLGNFLFFWLINIFSFFSTRSVPSIISLCFLLALATTYRYYWSQKKILNSFNNENEEGQYYWYSSFLALSLIFVFVIPITSYFVTGYFYFGNFAPNTWHNSTTIFLFPFALVLFELSYKQLIGFERKRNGWIALLILINIFIKPSYFFVFVSVYPFLLLIKYKLNKEFWYSIIPPAAGLIFLLVEYKGIYLTANHAEKEISTVIINPFYSYTRIEPLWLLPFSLLFSLLFPVCYAALNYSKLKKSELFWYTSLSFFVSVIIYLFFAETGPRATHGNFIWQVIICTWLCFFVSLLSLIRDIKIQGKTIKNKLLMSLYLIHVLMGVGYFIRLFVTGYYG